MSEPPFPRIVQRAKRFLVTDPFDAGHELTHHKLVVSNVQWIVEQEGLHAVDMESLLIAAWFHDYKRNQDELCDRVLSEIMTKEGYSQKEIEKVLTIKNGHSFGSDQNESLEAQILYDADKIEYVHYNPRYLLVSDAVSRGEMSKETFGKYLKAFEDRIKKVSETLHFAASRERFYDYLNDTHEWLLSTNPIAGEWRPLLPSIQTVLNDHRS